VSPSESGASGSTPLLPDEYDSLIDRLRETANEMIPRGATVLVVSRGDDELLRIGPRRALHFPQDEFGRYAGYHPSDSDSAIAALEDMRARGAEYLLLPSTSFWWLDYYEGLREHLDGNYPAIVSNDACMVFELLATGAQTGSGDADTDGVSTATQTRRLAGPLDELLQALLPRDASIAIAATDEVELPSFADVRSVRVSDPGDGLAAIFAAAGDAEFVVVPATAYDRVHESGALPVLLGPWQLVTRQQHMCEVWERVSGTEQPPPAPPGAVADAAPRASGGGRGLWQRIRDRLRRR
jgi:hypothetical protein